LYRRTAPRSAASPASATAGRKLREEYRQEQKRRAQRDEDRRPQLLVREELLEQVVRRFDVVSLPNDDSIDGIDPDAALDDRDDALVVGRVEDDDRRVGVVGVDEGVHLRRQRAVRPDEGVAAAGDHREDRLLAVVTQVASHPERF
jgi:hypothetical protein